MCDIIVPLPAMVELMATPWRWRQRPSKYYNDDDDDDNLYNACRQATGCRRNESVVSGKVGRRRAIMFSVIVLMGTDDRCAGTRQGAVTFPTSISICVSFSHPAQPQCCRIEVCGQPTLIPPMDRLHFVPGNGSPSATNVVLGVGVLVVIRFSKY